MMGRGDEDRVKGDLQSASRPAKDMSRRLRDLAREAARGLEIIANNTREADAALLGTDAAVVLSVVFLEGALDAAQEQGIKNSWGLLAPLSADPAHLAASINMASCIALTWAAAALFSGCATAPSIYLLPQDAAYLAFQTSIVAVPAGLLLAIAASGSPLPQVTLTETVIYVPLALALWRASASWFLFR